MVLLLVLLVVDAALVGALFLGVCIGWAAHRRHAENDWLLTSQRLKEEC